MAIADIKQTKKKIKTELFINGKKCIFYTLIQQSYMMLGALMFFYIEECYFKVQTHNKPAPCIQLCHGIQKLNQSGYLVNPMSSHFPTTTATTINNESLETIFQEILNNCQNKQCQENQTQFQKRCKLDEAGFVTWSVYSFTVIYTVGMYSTDQFIMFNSQ